jgi:CDP-glycerol glycerophosphotransferase (TagB/SpsB family)
MRWHELKHIFVNHGESDKAVNVSKFLRCYDKLYLSGQLAVDRIEGAGLGISEERFALVGRPQTDMALTAQENIIDGNHQITVLYAPTWEGFSEGADYTSVSTEACSAFSQLLACKKLKILFKPHPYTGIVKPGVAAALKELKMKFKKASNVDVYGPDKNIHDLMNESDLMITDISSVLNDYLYTDKPIIVTNPLGLSANNLHQLFPSSRGAYLLDQNMLSLSEIIVRVRGKDSLKRVRAKVKEYSLGAWPKGALARFNEQLSEDLTVN